MKRAVLTSAIALMSMSSAAFAQVQTPAAAPAKPAPAANQATGASTDVQQDLMANLQKAGFSNIKIVADSFLVQATDKSGNLVTIFLRPDSMTVVSETEGRGRNSARGAFANLSAKDELTSKVVGIEVYNSANQDVGTIKDVAFNTSGVKAYILGVGGFIGMGEHHVAVRPSSITFTYNTAEKSWHAAMDVNADQLKAA